MRAKSFALISIFVLSIASIAFAGPTVLEVGALTGQAHPLCKLAFTPSVETSGSSLNSEYPDLDQRYQSVLQMARVATPESPLLTIVIPAYREALRLPNSLKKIREFLDQYPLPVQVLVMVEKSPDQTLELASQVVQGDPRFQVVDNMVKNGKGYAVRSGMMRATGKYVLFMDADLSTPLPEIINFLYEFQQHPNVDVMVGDRWANGQENKEHRSTLRKVFSATFNTLVRMVSVRGIRDTQAGFKAFTMQANHSIFSKQTLNGFAFDVEVLLLAQKLGYKVAAVPIHWVDDKRSTVHPIFDPLKMFRDLLMIRLRVYRNLKSAKHSGKPQLNKAQTTLSPVINEIRKAS